MADAVDELLYGNADAARSSVPRAAQPGAVQPVAEGDLVDELLYGGKRPGTQQPKPKNAQLTYDADKRLGFIDEARGSFASDDTEFVRSAARSLYPKEPVEVAAKRFGVTEEGRYYHKGDDGKLYELRAPSGLGRAAQIGAGVGRVIPAVTGGVTGIVTAPMAATGVGLIGTVGATGAAAAGGEALRQKIGDAIYGEDSTKSIDPKSVILEGGTQALGQGIGLGIGKYVQGKLARDIGNFNPQGTSDVYDLADKYKVPVTPGEATGLASQIAEQKRLSGVPASANTMRDFLTDRNTAAADAFRRLQGRISSTGVDATTTGRVAQDVAEEAMTAARQGRSALTGPVYKEAFETAKPVDVSNVVEYIKTQLPVAKGPMRSALIRADKTLKLPNGDYDTSLQGLDAAKKSIDDMLSSYGGKEGIGANTRGLLEQVRQRLVAAMDAGGGKYAEARQLHGQLTEMEVDPVRRALAPLLRSKDEKAVAMASRMFDPNTRSPQVIAQARSEFAKRGQTTVWNELVRQYLREEGGRALKTMTNGEMRNVAGNVSKIFADEHTVANLKAALSPRQFQDFSDLMKLFRAAGRGIDGNSDTAFKLEAMETARSAARPLVAKILRNINPAEALRSADTFFTSRNFDRQAEALAKIVTSGDRKAINQLKALRQYNPRDWRVRAAAAQIISQSTASSAGAYFDQPSVPDDASP